ncbi:MAG: DUF1255 family protein [Proteobacteria bacterium]|nr:DUF1255 family protein [Pseudomonadota bacterium]
MCERKSQVMKGSAMIKVNEYLDGKVKSLGFEREKILYTAGVLLPGEYAFDTEKEEHITVTVGEFEVRPPGGGWTVMKARDTVVIPAKSTFDLRVEKPASYVCMYQ